MDTQTVSSTDLTLNVVLLKLQERVSHYDARLILDSAVVTSGLRSLEAQGLDSEQAKNLCLELIKKGGPAFQVGTALYREYLQ
jgi:hypothetical protein